MRVFIYIFNILFFVVLLLSVFFVVHFTTKVETPKVFEVPKGSISKVIEKLNIELDGEFLITDRYLLSYFGYPQAGKIEFPEKEMMRWKILKHLTEAKKISSKEFVTLIPGETTLFFLKEFAKEYKISFEELKNYYFSTAPIKEGFLIPDTYTMNLEKDPKKFLKDFIYRSNSIHKKRMAQFGIERFSYWKKVLIVASIVEKESGTVEEMPLVSSVIYNRLREGMRLQMDGTLNYGLYSHQRVTPERIRNDNSRYNTYKYSGIPPEPICNPSLTAIESALKPAKTNYLYFMRKKGTDKHVFTATYQEHLKAIEENR